MNLLWKYNLKLVKEKKYHFNDYFIINLYSIFVDDLCMMYDGIVVGMGWDDVVLVGGCLCV